MASPPSPLGQPRSHGPSEFSTPGLLPLALRVLSRTPHCPHRPPPPSRGLRTHLRPHQRLTLLRKRTPTTCSAAASLLCPQPPSQPFPLLPPMLIPRAMAPHGDSPTQGCPQGRAHAAHGGSPRPGHPLTVTITDAHGGWQHVPGAGGHVNTRQAHTLTPGTATCRVHMGLLTGWHTGCRVCWAWQLQGSQPRGPPRFQKRGAQRLQSRPRVWGRQGHCPLTGSQKQASAPGGHLAGTVPRGSQLQPGERAGLTGTEERTHHPPWAARPPHRTLTPAAPWAQGTAVEAGPAVGTAGAVAVVQASLAAPSARVAGGRIAGVDVVVALAGPARAPPGLLPRPRAPKVARGAAVTAGPWRAGCMWAPHSQKGQGVAGRAEGTIATSRPLSWLPSAAPVLPPRDPPAPAGPRERCPA